MSGLRKFWRLPYTDKALFFEALFTQFWVKCIISFVPMRRYINSLGEIQAETEIVTLYDTKGRIISIGRAIVRCRSVLHFKNRCYPEAITAKKMLARRGFSSTLYIGVCKEVDKVSAHAWLRCGNIYVCGKREMSKFAVVSTIA